MRVGWWSAAAALLVGCGFEAANISIDATVAGDIVVERPFDPANLDGIGDLAGVTGGLDLADGMFHLDTMTMRLTRAGVDVNLAGGALIPHTTPPLVVLAVDHFTLAPTATLRVTGDRALLILSRRDVVIRGRLDASAACTDGARSCGGPGGGDGGTANPANNGFIGAKGCGPGGRGIGDLLLDEAGAGGGGYGTGGGGGGASIDGGAGGAGIVCGEPTLEPLVGGSGGGAAGYASSFSDDKRTPGGGGGGALQITALTTLRIEGTIIASGEGGSATRNSLDSGGGGGGSGGAILLESYIVTLAEGAHVAANGGGGGSGSTAERDGSSGLPAVMRAPGGISIDGTNGGFGGFGAAPADAATAGANRADGASGGGGGAGRIRINGTTITVATGSISPAETRGSLTVTPQ